MLLALCAELLLRVVYFQMNSTHEFAVEAAILSLQRFVRQGKTDQGVQQVRSYLPVYQAASDALYHDEGNELREELESEYVIHFQRFAQLAKQAGSKLVVLSYFKPPSPFGQLIATLAEQHGLDHVNVSDQLAAYPEERISLRPHDLHLSRFGNFIVAEALAAYLSQYSAYRNPATYSGTPVLLGDLTPNINQIYSRRTLLPYRVQSNVRGLRMVDDIEIPKKRQRILCIGDSNTFGYGVHNQDTFPALLERLAPQLEVLNAGVSGYTISDETALFEERARHAAPDITILQVTHNDIIELTAYRKNLTGRTAGEHIPSAAEEAFFRLIEQRLVKEKDTTRQ